MLLQWRKASYIKNEIRSFGIKPFISKVVSWTAIWFSANRKTGCTGIKSFVFLSICSPLLLSTSDQLSAAWWHHHKQDFCVLRLKQFLSWHAETSAVELEEVKTILVSFLLKSEQFNHCRVSVSKAFWIAYNKPEHILCFCVEVGSLFWWHML